VESNATKVNHRIENSSPTTVDRFTGQKFLKQDNRIKLIHRADLIRPNAGSVASTPDIVALFSNVDNDVAKFTGSARYQDVGKEYTGSGELLSIFTECPEP
jgi:hypothetical protein